MDQKKIKNIVANCLWPKNEPKCGDEYRRLSGKVERFCKMINTNDDMKQIFPIEWLSDEEIAVLCISFIKRNTKKNRYIFTKLGNKSLTYNYDELVTKDEIYTEGEYETKNKELMEDEIEVGLNRIKNTSDLFVYRRIPYADEKTFEYILKDLEEWSMDCKYISFNLSDRLKRRFLETNHLICVRTYLECAYDIIHVLLKYFIVFNDNIKYRREKLLQLKCELEKVCSKKDNYVSKLKEKLEDREPRYRELFKQFRHPEEKFEELLQMTFKENANKIIAPFIEILYFRAKFNSKEKIWNWLEEEMITDQQLFGKDPLILDVDVDSNNKELVENFITEGLEVKNYKVKYDETIKFINIMHGNMRGLDHIISKIDFEIKELRIQIKFFDLFLQANRKPQLEHLKMTMRYAKETKRDLAKARQIFIRDREEYKKRKQIIRYHDMLLERRKEIDASIEILTKIFQLSEYKGDLEIEDIKDEAANIRLIKVYFREIFMSKVLCYDEENHKKQRAQSIVREILAGNKVSSFQMKFLKEKINRGYCRELGLLEEYKCSNDILIICKNILLRCLYYENEIKIFSELHNEFCNILRLISKYSK